ncbi:MAG: class I SAM-dependent methyltransferase [Agriterribacter sp.]
MYKNSIPPDRSVGEEARKTFKEKLESGFFDKYMPGVGLDIGGTGYIDNVLPILPGAIIVDLDYPGYDGETLPFKTNSQDYVYSSHCLEHISDYKNAIREWHRVTKENGFIIIAVPHKYLYEKQEALPSRYNADHKRMYTASSLLKEIEDALIPNSFRIRYLNEDDTSHDYTQPNDQHSSWCYEIVVVIEKLQAKCHFKQ